MSERVDSLPLSSFIEGERRARIKRTLVIEACLRGTLHTFSEWLRVAAVRGARVLQGLAARRCLRRAIRELHRLDDRTLRDIGVTRGEIESAVCEGLPMRPLREPSRRFTRADRLVEKRLAARRLTVGARER